MHGAEAVNPAGRAVAARNSRNQLDERVIPVLEAVKAGRLHDTEQPRLTHFGNQVSGHLAVLFGFERVFARQRTDRASALQQLVHAGLLTYARGLNCIDRHAEAPIIAGPEGQATTVNEAYNFIISSGGIGPHRFAALGSFAQTFGRWGLSRCHGLGSK